jgi:hypothetical protein
VSRFKIAAGWAYWAVYQVLSLFFGALGLIVIPILARAGAVTDRQSRIPAFQPREVMCFKGGILTDAWNNDEDGIDGGDAHFLANLRLPEWRAIFDWSAIRNFSNGLRRLPLAFYVLTKDDKVVVRPTKSGSVTTCGWRQCVIWRGVRFGFLITTDAKEGYRVWPIAGRA